MRTATDYYRIAHGYAAVQHVAAMTLEWMNVEKLLAVGVEAYRLPEVFHVLQSDQIATIRSRSIRKCIVALALLARSSKM